MEPVKSQPSSQHTDDILDYPKPERCPVEYGCWGDGLKGHDFEGNRIIPRYCSCPRGKALADGARLRRAEMRVEESGIPLRFVNCSLDSYPATPENRAIVDSLREWAYEEKGLFITGDYGTGKTGLACAVLTDVIQTCDVAGMFVTVPALLDSIRASYEKGADVSEHALIRKVMDIDVLVLDDIGAEKPSEWVVEKLFSIINHRHDWISPTIFTSNLSIAQLAERLGERTTWRIVEMCDVVHLKGPNLRAKP